MKLGYFTDTYVPQFNGVVTSILSFREELEKKGHEVFVFAPKARKRGFKESDSRVFRFPSIPSVVYPDIQAALPFSPKTLAKIPKLGLDLIHTHDPVQMGVLGNYFARKLDLPLVHTYHTLLSDYVSYYKLATPATIMGLIIYPLLLADPKAYRDLFNTLRTATNRTNWNKVMVERASALYCNQADLVIAPSKKLKRLLRSWGTKAPVEVLATGIHPEEFRGGNGRAFRAEHGIGPRVPLVLFLGRIAPEKNLGMLLPALKQIKHTIPEAKLLVVGDGPFKKPFTERAHKLGLSRDVIFTGYLDRSGVREAFAASDVFVFPSLTDTQALVMLEAAAAGKPLVAADTELSDILVDGKTGFAAENSASGFARPLVKLLSDRKLRLAQGAAARREAERYTAYKQTAKLLQWYYHLTKEHAQTTSPK